MLSILFSFIFFSACGDTDKTSETTKNGGEVVNRAESTTPPNTEKQSVQKFVTLGGSVTETVYALGEGSKVVGVDVSSLHPPEVNGLPKVGYYRQISAEGIISLEPTLVIGSSASGPADALEKVKNVGIPLEILSAKKTLVDAKARITDIAKILKKEEQGKKIVSEIDIALAKLEKPATPPRVLFIYARGAGAVNVAGKNTAAAEMIALAGGINCVDGYEGYKPINSEAIIAAAPDFVLLTDRGLKSIGGVESVAKLPGISLTTAGKEKNIISMDDLLLLGFGPRVGQAAQELANKLKK